MRVMIQVKQVTNKTAPRYLDETVSLHLDLCLDLDLEDCISILSVLVKKMHEKHEYILMVIFTSKCMHGMNQTEAEYSRHGKRSQRASLSQIGPVVLEV